ncbi:MAG: MFS transporter [Acidimicrobiales bacterium]|nr:MAG: MFS transporter [Acidimicrobiales bacterium]
MNSDRAIVRSPLLAMWPLFLGVALMMLGNGLQATLLGVRSSLEDFDTAVIGAIQTAYYAGFLIGSRFTMRALSRVGHIRVFAALASMASTAALLHVVFINAPTWFAMRLVTGFCMAGLYVVAESWLNDQAPPDARGRTLSIYMVVTMGSLTGGQFLLNVADPISFELFIIASVLVSLSLVPMSLADSRAPAFAEAKPLPIRELWGVVPSGVVTMFLSGAAAATLFGIGPVYAARVGMSTRDISLFISASVIGATIFQLPIGALSDKLPRRSVIIAVAIGATAASVYGVTTNGGFPGLIAMFAIGATSFPIYSLAIAYTNDWVADDQRVGSSALLVMVNGIGAVSGPFIASVLMRTYSNSMYFWMLATLHGVMAAYLLYRVMVMDAKPIEEQSTYRALPARSSVGAAILGRRTVKPKKKSKPSESSR